MKFSYWKLLLLALMMLSAKSAQAQAFGIELFNNGMPASGAMGGASLATPQDVQSAINGNPATMTQFRGTQFSFGGVWIEPTYNLSVGPPGLPLFGVSQFDTAKSDAQGIAGGNIGVTQDLSALGLPVTIGMGLMSGAGAGVDFRQIPESNGTHANILALDITMGAGIDLTDRLSLGATMIMSAGTMDGPFVGITGSSTDYALLGNLGLNYKLTPDTNIGVTWRTEGGYTFENLAGFTQGTYFDVSADRPEVVGMGIANTSLMDGRLLLALDAVFQKYSDTELFGAIYNDQWAVQLGAQYSPNDRIRLRMGYAWADNPMREAVGNGAGGVVPPGFGAHVQYIQALFASIPQHRLTGGFSVRDVLPGIDMNFFGGGMFEDSQTFGITTATLKSYWVGTGFVWRFGRGACEAGEWK